MTCLVDKIKKNGLYGRFNYPIGPAVRLRVAEKDEKKILDPVEHKREEDRYQKVDHTDSGHRKQATHRLFVVRFFIILGAHTDMFSSIILIIQRTGPYGPVQDGDNHLGIEIPSITHQRIKGDITRKGEIPNPGKSSKSKARDRNIRPLKPINSPEFILPR